MPTETESPLDRALDELYAATPPEFVLVRSRLERELRHADEPSAAADIRSRRRPNLGAWACNQLARRDPEGIAELIALTHRLAEAQQAVVNGQPSAAWRDVSRERRELLEHLAATAIAELAPWAPKPATYRDPVAATLDAASLDPDIVPDLEAGRLTRALSSPAGLGPLPEPNARPLTPPAGRRGPSKRDREAAQRELTQAQREAKQLAAAADTATTEQSSAEMQADATTAQLREVERAIERARGGARHATREAQAARDRTKGARLLADRAEQRVRRAEQHLRDLDAP